MGEIVHKANISNTREPVLLALGGDSEELGSNVIQNVFMKMASQIRSTMAVLALLRIF